MRNYLVKIDWDNCWHILNAELEYIIDTFIPLKNVLKGQERNVYQKKPLGK